MSEQEQEQVYNPQSGQIVNPNLPVVTVAIVTYKREKLLAQTLESLFTYLQYEGELRYLVSHDGNAYETRDFLHGYWGWDFVQIAGSGERRGLGANNNQAIAAAFRQSDIILHTQDDYQLIRPLDITPHVLKLRDDERAGWVRLRLASGQNFVAENRDAYWWIDWQASPGLYIASDQPHLKHFRFHEKYGTYPEHLPVADTENSWCGQTKQTGREHPDYPKVLIPVSYLSDDTWLHTGDNDSWKEKGF